MNSAQVSQECFINAELASMVRIRQASWMLDIEVGRLCCRTEGSLRNAGRPVTQEVHLAFRIIAVVLQLY
jgi:hypothetical protein